MFEFLSDPFVKPLIEWTGTIVIGGLVYKAVKQELSKFGNAIVLQTKDQITSIDDPDLREMVRYAIRYAATRLPDVKGNERLEAIIKAIQDATPNFIISDDQLRDLIESEFLRIKSGLASL